MDKIRPVKKPGIFYGYWIVVVAFFCAFIFSGCGFYTFSLFVKPLQEQLGWSRGTIMAAFTVLFVVYGVASPFIGRLMDRYGARRVMFIGALIMGLGFIILSQLNALWNLYIGWAVVGIGMSAVGAVPATGLVSNWFKRRRGTAIGIMSTGIGAGGFAVAPVLGSYLIPVFDWRTSFVVLAVIVWVVIIPLALFVVKTRPSDMGLYPDGMEAPANPEVNRTLPLTAEGLSLKMALATPALWLIGISYLTSMFAEVGVIQNQVPHLDDIGFPVATAASALGGVALGSLVGKFFFGWLCDRIPAKYAWGIGLSLQLSSIVLFMNVEAASPLSLLWLYAVLMGVGGAGGWLPTMSMVTSTTFGLASYGAIFGIVTLFQAVGTATGPLMAGYMYDALHSYHQAFIIFIALCAVAAAAILMVRRVKSS